ncbi:MAG: hypothetical protein HQM16_17070 [Deltaproteobacteria bacterium]|nr:hypothetical protein [Deltaproteobacteria bacterium]
MNYNPQSNNVGNIGDIIKHAALVELARLIQGRNPDTCINYLDTHAYLYKSPCTNNRWAGDVQLLAKKYKGYTPYYEIEQSFIQQGHYLCSSALAVKTLKDPRLFLAEKNDVTRATLANQLSEAGVKYTALKHDFKDFLNYTDTSTCGPIFGLIDPFKLNDHEWQGLWQVLSNTLNTIHNPQSDALFIVFNFSKTGTPAWQLPPNNLLNIVGVIKHAPYYLAVYATKNIAGPAQAVLNGLGWDVGEICNRQLI